MNRHTTVRKYAKVGTLYCGPSGCPSFFLFRVCPDSRIGPVSAVLQSILLLELNLPHIFISSLRYFAPTKTPYYARNLPKILCRHLTAMLHYTSPFTMYFTMHVTLMMIRFALLISVIVKRSQEARHIWTVVSFHLRFSLVKPFYRAKHATTYTDINQ